MKSDIAKFLPHPYEFKCSDCDLYDLNLFSRSVQNGLVCFPDHSEHALEQNVQSNKLA